MLPPIPHNIILFEKKLHPIIFFLMSIAINRGLKSTINLLHLDSMKGEVDLIPKAGPVTLTQYQHVSKSNITYNTKPV